MLLIITSVILGVHVARQVKGQPARPTDQIVDDGTVGPEVVDAGTEQSVEGIATGDTVQVKRVIDGDTIELATGQKVRYIGVDTPETVDPRRPVGCFGKEASNVNKSLVNGKPVRLEKDISETDKYSRLLRYVYVQTDQGELFVNDYLARQGYAMVKTYPPDVKYEAQFLQAQQEARENNRGLWAKCPTR